MRSPQLLHAPAPAPTVVFYGPVGHQRWAANSSLDAPLATSSPPASSMVHQTRFGLTASLCASRSSRFPPRVLPSSIHPIAAPPEPRIHQRLQSPEAAARQRSGSPGGLDLDPATLKATVHWRARVSASHPIQRSRSRNPPRSQVSAGSRRVSSEVRDGSLKCRSRSGPAPDAPAASTFSRNSRIPALRALPPQQQSRASPAVGLGQKGIRTQAFDQPGQNEIPRRTVCRPGTCDLRPLLIDL